MSWFRRRRLPVIGGRYKREGQWFVVLGVGARAARVLYTANGSQGVVPLDDFVRRIARRRRWG